MNFNLWDTIVKAFGTVIEQMAEAFPKLIGAIVLLGLGWVISKIISNVVGRILRRIGLDKLAEKLNNTDTFKESNIKVRPVIIIQKFLYWMLMLVFILSATETLGLDIVTTQISGLIDYIPQLVTALIILAVGFYISDAIRSMTADSMKSLGIPAWKFISTALFYLLFLIVAVTALSQAGINTDIITSNFSIILGGIVLAFAIAYGFAARNVLSSILTSFYSKNSYQMRQVIELDGYKGEIVKMDSVSITIDTGEKLVVFPLSRLIKDTVIIHQSKEDEEVRRLED
ncbi:MAG: hypothetical protein KDE26_02270 [Bacteroidetes bacterium]|nr:hypothetical protein [Bacteroidota bacterium]MCB0842070.1 hypothetical protein [Bacteroidota bacterium]